MNEKELRNGEEEQVTGKPRRMGLHVLLAALAVTALCGSALATDGGSTDTGMTAVLSSVDTLSSLLVKVWTLLTGNPYLALYLALGLASAGLGLFIRAKRVARR